MDTWEILLACPSMGCSKERRVLNAADPGELQPRGTSTAQGLAASLPMDCNKEFGNVHQIWSGGSSSEVRWVSLGVVLSWKWPYLFLTFAAITLVVFYGSSSSLGTNAGTVLLALDCYTLLVFWNRVIELISYAGFSSFFVGLPCQKQG